MKKSDIEHKFIFYTNKNVRYWTQIYFLHEWKMSDIEHKFIF
jgi:hypothetical protein